MTVKLFPLILFCFVLAYFSTYSQITNPKQRTLAVIDSVPLIDNGITFFGDKIIEIENVDIYHADTILDKEKINSLGYSDIDSLVFIVTMGYHYRTDEERAIPSSSNLNLKKGTYFLKGSKTPYTGDVIDYYYSGKIFGKAHLCSGLLCDTLASYYPDGKTKKTLAFCRNGALNGQAYEYFPNEKVKASGTYLTGKKSGYWQENYSTGQYKQTLIYTEGKWEVEEKAKRFWKLYNEGVNFKALREYRKALRSFDDALELKRDFSDLYIEKGFTEGKLLMYDQAITDMDTAIMLEPYSTQAIGARIMMRIRRSKAVETAGSPNSEGSSDALSIADKDKICFDLTTIRNYEKQGIAIPIMYSLAGMSAENISNEIKKYCR